MCSWPSLSIDRSKSKYHLPFIKLYKTKQETVCITLSKFLAVFFQQPWCAHILWNLLLRTPAPVPFGTCICSNVETILSWTCHVYGPFEFRTSLGTSILLTNDLSRIECNVSFVQLCIRRVHALCYRKLLIFFVTCNRHSSFHLS